MEQFSTHQLSEDVLRRVGNGNHVQVDVVKLGGGGVQRNSRRWRIPTWKKGGIKQEQLQTSAAVVVSQVILGNNNPWWFHRLPESLSRLNAALWRHLLCEGGRTRALTAEAVDVVASVTLGEARLVALTIDGPDPGLPTTTAFPRGDDGVAHASVGQPARAAEAQPVVPGRVQLSCSGHFCTVTPTEGLGLPEGETLGGGAMEHLTCAQ